MAYDRNQSHRSSEPKEFEEKIIQVSRVSKKTKGGNKIGFSVLVVVGDRKGRVGVGLGKGPDVLSSIQKAVRRAKKRLITIPIKNGTIPFPVNVKKGAATVLLKPAPLGTGVIAGGAVRAVVEAAGIHNIVSKILGSSNQASNVYATFDALGKIKALATLKGIKLNQPATAVKKPATTLPSKPAPAHNSKPAPKRSPSAAKPTPKKS